MSNQKLTYEDLNKFYQEKTGISGRVQPLAEIYKWASQQPEIIINKDTSLSFIEKVEPVKSEPPMGLILPKPHISWSSMSCWNSSPARFRKEYFEAGEKLNTKYLRFGAGIAKLIEEGKHTELLPDLVVCDSPEFEIRTTVCGVPILSYIDSYDSINNVFREYKTGKIPWTMAKVIKHGQLVFYATALKHSCGKIPEYCHLDWIETRETTDEEINDFWRDNEKTVKVTGKIKSFPREFDEREIEKMEELIVKSANEISEAYQDFLKEI